MTGLSILFHTYQDNFGRDKVRIADDLYSSMADHGDIHATLELSFSYVLHVPNFTLNLLSISYLIKHLNCCVTFFPSYCLFQELETKKTIGLGHVKDGFYISDFNTPVASLVIKGNLLSSDELLLWHCRLSHPSFSLLRQNFPHCFF